MGVIGAGGVPIAGAQAGVSAKQGRRAFRPFGRVRR